MQLTFPEGDTITLPTFTQMRDWYRARKGEINCHYGGDSCLVALPVTYWNAPCLIGVYPSSVPGEATIEYGARPYRIGQEPNVLPLPEAYNRLADAFDNEMFDNETGTSRASMPYEECATFIEKFMEGETA